jgi:hypothetical protein
VAAGGAAGATLMATGKSPSSLIRFIGDVTLSPNDPCDVCSSNTQDPLVAKGTSGNPYTNTESMFIWVKFLGIPNGTYSFDLSPTIQPKGTGTCPPGIPLSFGAGSNSINVYTFPNGPRNCIPASLAGLPASPLATQNTLAIQFTISGGPLDVLVQCHLQNDCDNAGTYTVTGTLSPVPGTGTSGSPVSCSNDIHVAAKKKDE